ncbi:cupin domain-containing protein [Mariniluteicoccus flavus]
MTAPDPASTMVELLDLPDRLDLPEGERPSVQRVLVGDGCRVVMFAFRVGQELREHSAAFPILVQPLRGEVDFTCGGRTAALAPGSVVHVPARVRHAVRATTDASMMLTMLDPDARLGEDTATTRLPDA